MTSTCQRRKAVAELVSGEFEASSVQNNQIETYFAGPSKSPKIQSEKLDEIKTSLRKGIMFDLTMVFAENQKEALKLIAPVVEKPATLQNLENVDSIFENVFPNTTSTPIQTIVTSSKTTPVNSRNKYNPSTRVRTHDLVSARQTHSNCTMVTRFY